MKLFFNWTMNHSINIDSLLFINSDAHTYIALTAIDQIYQAKSKNHSIP